MMKLVTVGNATTSGKNKRGIACPACGSPTWVRNSRTDETDVHVRRQRRCPNGHAFHTVETLIHPRLDLYAVRRSSDHKLSPDTFSATKFRSQLSSVLFGRRGPFDEKTLDVISDRALRRLESELPHVRTRLSEAEYRSRPGIIGALPDTVISSAVEKELSAGQDTRYRMAELLYVMAIRGRSDIRTGWSGAGEVLAWIRQEDDQLAAPRPQAAFEDPGLRLPAAVRTTWRPEEVFKRTGPPAPFAMHRFEKSIRLALWGREEAGPKALMIAHLVLGELKGQRTVHSSQLATYVLSALRRVDDVGYLRWNVFVKGIASVEQFATEANDLVAYPSPRLKLSPGFRRLAKNRGW
jgi:transcriptional regulator NrdR family protein